MRETEIVKALEDYLVERQFLCFKELQITSKILDMGSIANSRESQKQIRIDLAAIHPLDGGIVFFEAESEFFVEHPITYLNLADYVFLACPEKAVQGATDEVRRQQLEWASEVGLGIITVYPSHNLKIMLDARLHKGFDRTIRLAIHKAMMSRNSQAGHVKGAWWASSSEETIETSIGPMMRALKRLRTAEKAIESGENLKEAVELLKHFMEDILRGILITRNLDPILSEKNDGFSEEGIGVSVEILLRIIEENLSEVWEHIHPAQNLILNYKNKVIKLLDHQRKIKVGDVKRLVMNCWFMWNNLRLAPTGV